MGHGHAICTLVNKVTTDSDAVTAVEVQTDSGILITLEHGISTGVKFPELVNDARRWLSFLLKGQKGCGWLYMSPQQRKP